MRKTPATLFRALVYRVPRDTHLESVQHRCFATTLRELPLWRDYPQHERNESCFTEKGALLRQTLNLLTSSLTLYAPGHRSQEKAIGRFTYLNLSIDCGSKPRSFHVRSLRGSRQPPNYFSLFRSRFLDRALIDIQEEPAPLFLKPAEERELVRCGIRL